MVYLRNTNFRLMGLSCLAHVPVPISGAVSGVSFQLMLIQRFTSSTNAFVLDLLRSTPFTD